MPKPAKYIVGQQIDCAILNIVKEYYKLGCKMRQNFSISKDKKYFQEKKILLEKMTSS